MIRAVIDTNVFVSILFGSPVMKELLESCATYKFTWLYLKRYILNIKKYRV